MQKPVNINFHTTIVGLDVPDPVSLIIDLVDPDGVPMPRIKVPTPASAQNVSVPVDFLKVGTHTGTAFDADANDVAILPPKTFTLNVTVATKAILIGADSISV